MAVPGDRQRMSVARPSPHFAPFRAALQGNLQSLGLKLRNVEILCYSVLFYKAEKQAIDAVDNIKNKELSETAECGFHTLFPLISPAELARTTHHTKS